jgi:hypothetical protein
MIYLGANVPLIELKETIDNLNPTLLIMPAQQLYTAANLAEVAHALHTKVPIAFGGLVFSLIPEIRSLIPGYYIGEELENISESIEELIRKKKPQQQVLPSSKEYREALAHFQDQQAAIEAQTWEILSNNGIERQHLVIANRYLTQDIEAALALGDLQLLRNEIEWLEGLLSNYEVPTDGLHHFLHTYLGSAEQVMDARGQPVINWLSNTLANIQ